MAVSLGPEFNMNSRENFAAGAVLGFDCNILRSCAVGFTVTGSDNFSGIVTHEPAALFRWYFPGRGHTGFFAQADMGVCIISEDGGLSALFLAGVRGGYRFALGRRFFLEPYGRGGYPFTFGIGVAAGVRF